MDIKKIENILFDLDGTVTDPKEGITKSVAYALQSFGIKVDDLDSLLPFIGPPLMESFERFYGFDSEKSWQAVLKYREYFSEIGINQNASYSGMEELLGALQAHGKKLFLATSKPTVFAKIVIENFGLTKYFDSIVGATEDGGLNEKADIIRYCLQENGISPQNAVMIGDRKHDIIGAAANKLPSIGVLYGYGSYEELAAHGATFLVKDLQQLRALLIE